MKRTTFALTLLAATALVPSAASAGTLSCAALASQALLSPGVVSATSVVTPASGPNAAYCQVNLTQGAEQSMNIRVGLPLNAGDGGTGGSAQGAWNGRIQNLGNGGYAGSVTGVTGATNARYVGSGSDDGHSNASCAINSQPGCGLAGGGFLLSPSNNLIQTRVDEFIRLSEIEQVRWAKRLTQMYYGQAQQYNYWNGCSTGGRQGMEMAQSYGDQFDGILAGSPAINWNRFIIGDLWAPVAIKDTVGLGGIASTKVDAVNAAAVAACDANDGVLDGIVNEPRRCTYNANSFICVANGGPSSDPNCLTPQEATAVNLVWDGARNQRGQRLWGGLTRGTSFGILVSPGLAGPVADTFGLDTTYLINWMHQNPAFDWHTVTMANFSSEFQLSDIKFQATASTDNPVLDKLKNHGGKLIHYHGLGDPLIVPYGSQNYVSRVFGQYGVPTTQTFMRSFFYPAQGHCGGGASPAINSVDLFNALVNWVENGVAPDYIVATQASPSRTRKICKYPDEAIYNGSGSTDDQANFTCVVHTTEPADLAAQSLTAKRFNEVP